MAAYEENKTKTDPNEGYYRAGYPGVPTEVFQIIVEGWKCMKKLHNGIHVPSAEWIRWIFKTIPVLTEPSRTTLSTDSLDETLRDVLKLCRSISMPDTSAADDDSPLLNFKQFVLCT